MAWLQNACLFVSLGIIAGIGVLPWMMGLTATLLGIGAIGRWWQPAAGGARVLLREASYWGSFCGWLCLAYLILGLDVTLLLDVPPTPRVMQTLHHVSPLTAAMGGLLLASALCIGGLVLLLASRLWTREAMEGAWLPVSPRWWGYGRRSLLAGFLAALLNGGALWTWGVLL